MKNKKLLILSSLFLTFAMTSCGENFPSHVSYPEGDNGEVKTPYEEYDNGKRIESISFKENNVSLNLSAHSEYQIEASFAPSDAHNPELSYTSNNPEIAVVDDAGKVTMLAPGNASISVSSDNGVSADFKISGYIPATSIRINPHVEGGALLDIYDTKQFSIATEPANATQKDVTWSVVDKNGNPSSIAVISETGLLSFENAKGVHDLEFNVVATSKADASLVASEKVIVNDARKYASSVKISKDGVEVSTVDVLLGLPEQLEAIVDPDDHTNPVTWTSEDATVATVDEGLVSAVKAPATTNVKASIDGLESKVVVNTTKIDVTAVSLDKTTLTLNKGEEATLVATVAPSDASFPEVSFVVADGSNDFVSIDQNGKVTAKKQTGATPAKVIAVSKDNNEIFAECLVTVTNKVTAIEIVNPYEKMYYGGETYALSLDKTPYDCEDFDVTWTSSNDLIATVDENGVVTTNTNELTGQVTIEATVNGADICDFIDINIIKPAAPFSEGHMYLVGNRNYQATGLDYEHASWDDSDYAVELTSMLDPNYKNQWALTDFHLERYDANAASGDLFKIRSVDWPEFSLDQSSTKSAYFTDEGNLAVSNSEKYNMYFKQNFDDSYSLYIMSEFQSGTMYLVGNRDYHTGESSGVPGTDTSWNDSSKALALSHDESAGQYHVANTFEANDEFKVRSDMFYDIALGTDEKTAAIAHVDQTTGNIILNKAGKFDIYFKSELGVWTVYMCDYVEPTPFMWGIAGSHITDWGLDTAHPFVESTVEGDAKYTYKISGYEFSENTEWKVKNTNNEWVANQSGVGFDLTKSTADAFSINNGNIKVLTAGTYDITLNIWEGATKDEYNNFINGVQIYAVKQAGPGPTPVEPTSVSIDQDGPITVKNGKTTTLSATIGPDGATGTLVWSSDNASVVAVDASTGVVTCNADEGSANISVKVSGHDDLTDSIVVNAAPDTFAWGIAGSATSWNLDTENVFVESTAEGSAKYTYKIAEYTFAAGDTWKVSNTNDEWVSNQDGVGIDLVASTKNAFSVDNGDIKVETTGTYTITLNIFEGATKDQDGKGKNFISGVQIIARDVNEPAPTKDNVLHATVDGVWTDFDLVKNPDNESEYMISKPFKKDDSLCFHMTGDTWYKFADLEEGCSSLVGSDADGNIKITKDGNYTFFIHATAVSGKFVWVNFDIVPPQLLVEGFLNPIDMAKKSENEYMVTNLELTTENAFIVNYIDDEDGCYQNFENVTDASLVFVENDGSNAIAPKADGVYDIYFDISKLDGKSITVTEHSEPVVVGDHVIYGKFGGETAWSQLVMSQSVDIPTQYEYTGDFAAGDVFVIHMVDTDEKTWLHFEDVKEGCLSLVELDGDENIKIKVAGNYTIYADSVADGQENHIWIKKNIAPAAMVIEGSEPLVMEVNPNKAGEFMIKNVSLETNEFFSFNYDGMSAGYANLKIDSPAGVTSNMDGHIAVTKAGSYDIYFDTNLIGDKCLYITEHVETITYTITFNDGWIFNDGAKIFAWVWSESKWVECTRVGTTNAVTIELTSETTGFNFVRADSSKTASTVGWPPDGSWNKSPDVSTTSGTHSISVTWNP